MPPRSPGPPDLAPAFVGDEDCHAPLDREPFACFLWSLASSLRRWIPVLRRYRNPAVWALARANATAGVVDFVDIMLRSRETELLAAAFNYFAPPSCNRTSVVSFEELLADIAVRATLADGVAAMFAVILDDCDSASAAYCPPLRTAGDRSSPVAPKTPRRLPLDWRETDTASNGPGLSERTPPGLILSVPALVRQAESYLWPLIVSGHVTPDCLCARMAAHLK